MADVTVTATQVRGLPGCLRRQFKAGAAITAGVGKVVYVAADGDVEVADASSAGSTNAQLGVIESGAKNHASGNIADQETVSVILKGLIFLGDSAALDETKPHYLSDTAGAIGDAAGTVTRFLGYPNSQTVFNFEPMGSAPTS